MSSATNPLPDWAFPVLQLADRVIGVGAADSIVLRQRATGDRTTTISATNGVITIDATDAISASVGLNHYLRVACNRAVHWDTDLPLDIGLFPDIAATEITAKVREQYLFNFCTFSYTMPYWDWEQWEREIDWMALHGITMPLCVVGHEAVVHEALLELGLPSERALEFLGSPAYLPFAYMGCLESELPAMDQTWLDKRAALGRRVLDRERSFGMTPVLPAFTGQVPRELAPDATTPRMWQEHQTWVLDPDHPLFVAAGAAITRVQVDMFGTNHLYASDPFIEMLPVEADPDYPGRVARGIVAGMVEGDPQATWVLQAWPFSDKSEYWTRPQVAAFLGSIDPGRLVILDLWAEIEPQWERFDSFAGTEWHWCGLLNFGGRTDPMANLRGAVATAQSALGSAHPPVGIGLAMEATRNNHVFFELLTDLAWFEIDDFDEWLNAFARQRYGLEASDPVAHAWSLLGSTVYSAAGMRLHPDEFRGLLTRRPASSRVDDRDKLGREVQSLVWYDPHQLVSAWELLTRSAELNSSSKAHTLGRDLIETAVAVLARVVDLLILRVVDSKGSDVDAARELLELFDALDSMLACHEEFRYSTWEEEAAGAASNADQRSALVTAARQILTTWNPEPSTVLDDYAGRIWHGLVGGYYRPRWEAWLRFAALGSPPQEADSLERTLDRLSEVAIRDGLPDQPRPLSDLADLSRAALDRFAPMFVAGFDRNGERA